jgi:hypothetical protein
MLPSKKHIFPIFILFVYFTSQPLRFSAFSYFYNFTILPSFLFINYHIIIIFVPLYIYEFQRERICAAYQG